MLGLKTGYSEVQAEASVSFTLSLSCFLLFVLNTIRWNISRNWVSAGCIQQELLENFPVEHMAIGRCWFIKSETLKIQFQLLFFFFLRRKGMIFYNQVNIASSVLNLLGSFLLFRWNCTIENKNKRRSQSKCSELLMNYQLIFFGAKSWALMPENEKQTNKQKPTESYNSLKTWKPILSFAYTIQEKNPFSFAT